MFSGSYKGFPIQSNPFLPEGKIFKVGDKLFANPRDVRNWVEDLDGYSVGPTPEPEKVFEFNAKGELEEVIEEK